MYLTIELPPGIEGELRAEDRRVGLTPEELIQGAVAEKLAATRPARNEALLELLRQWREEPPDLEEAEGYPEQITPLSLREVVIE